MREINFIGRKLLSDKISTMIREPTIFHYSCQLESICLGVFFFFFFRSKNIIPRTNKAARLYSQRALSPLSVLALLAK